MKSFKFFNTDQVTYHEDSHIMSSNEYLIEFTRRLDFKFVQHHGIFSEDHVHRPASVYIFNITQEYIREGHLTNHYEVIRFMTASYEDVTNVNYIISDVELAVLVVDTYDFIINRNNANN